MQQRKFLLFIESQITVVEKSRLYVSNVLYPIYMTYIWNASPLKICSTVEPYDLRPYFPRCFHIS